FGQVGGLHLVAADREPPRLQIAGTLMDHRVVVGGLFAEGPDSTAVQALVLLLPQALRRNLVVEVGNHAATTSFGAQRAAMCTDVCLLGLRRGLASSQRLGAGLLPRCDRSLLPQPLVVPFDAGVDVGTDRAGSDRVGQLLDSAAVAVVDDLLLDL